MLLESIPRCSVGSATGGSSRPMNPAKVPAICRKLCRPLGRPLAVGPWRPVVPHGSRSRARGHGFRGQKILTTRVLVALGDERAGGPRRDRGRLGSGRSSIQAAGRPAADSPRLPCPRPRRGSEEQLVDVPVIIFGDPDPTSRAASDVELDLNEGAAITDQDGFALVDTWDVGHDEAGAVDRGPHQGHVARWACGSGCRRDAEALPIQTACSGLGKLGFGWIGGLVKHN